MTGGRREGAKEERKEGRKEVLEGGCGLTSLQTRITASHRSCRDL